MFFQNYSLKKILFKNCFPKKYLFQKYILKIAFLKNISLIAILHQAHQTHWKKISQIIINMSNYFFLNIFTLF